MFFLKVDNKISISDYVNVSIDNSYLWHLRLGHINKDKLIRMSKSGLLQRSWNLTHLRDLVIHVAAKSLPKNRISEKFAICESCIKG
jgi:hypothetical protein